MIRLLRYPLAVALIVAASGTAFAATDPAPAAGLPAETKERVDEKAADAPPVARPSRPPEADMRGWVPSAEVRRYSAPATLRDDPALRDPLATGRNSGVHGNLLIPDAEGGTVLPDGSIDFRFGITYDTFRDTGTLINYTENGIRMAASPMDGLELRGYIAVGSWTGDIFSPLAFGVRTGEAMTDPVVTAKLRLLEPTQSSPLILSLIAAVKMPLGSPADFTSSGRRDLSGVLAGSLLLDDLTVNFDFGVVSVRTATFIATPDVHNTLYTYSAGFWYLTSDTLAIGAQFEGNTGYSGARPAVTTLTARWLPGWDGFRGGKYIVEAGLGLGMNDRSSDSVFTIRLRLAI